MAQTVGQHAVAAFSSPVNQTTPIDANTVRGNDNALRVGYVDHDADAGIHLQSSTLASRPVAGTAGRKWLTADSSSYRLFFDDGANWYELSYLSSAGGTISGNLTVTGNLSVAGTVTAGGFSGPLMGNAATATALQTSRTLWGQGFDGTANVTGALSSVTDITMTGTLSGAATVSATTLGGTLSTAAQPNVTSLGTLTALGVSGTATIGTLSVTGNTTLGNAAGDTVTVTGRVASNVEFSADNTYDVGASGANRPRTLYASTSVVTPLVTATTLGGTLSTAAQPNVTSLGTLTGLTLSGVANFAAGSASLPSLAAPSDPNTGVFFPAADTVALATGGTQQVTVFPNGTVRRGSLTGIGNSQKQSLGPGTSFTIDIAALFSGVITISGNFRYGRITFCYFISGRATIEEWLFSATNASVVAMTLVQRNSAGTAITGTPTLTSTDAVLSVALTTDASLAAGAAYVELAVV